MCLRNPVTPCLALLLLAAGCQKSSTAHNGATIEFPAPAPDTVLRVHWIGKRQLNLDGSAFYFTRLWDLQETRALESRTFDNLATAPWRMLHGNAAVSNAPVMLLRSLLESVKEQECFLEVRSATNSGTQLALAIQLSDAAAAAWQVDLARVIDSVTGFTPMADGEHAWSVDRSQAPFHIELAREKEWTVFGIVPRENQNAAMKELRERLRKHADASSTAPVRPWLTVDIDLQWAARISGTATNMPGRLPRVSLAVTGDGGNVLTHATLTFPGPLQENYEPWKIPVELIHEPLTSFIAARGTHGFLSAFPWWNGIHIGNGPNQLFFWSAGGNPFQIYLAAPVPDAGSRMQSFTTHLLDDTNPWLKNNGPKLTDSGIPLFEKLPAGNGVRWTIPGLWPFVQSVENAGRNFLFAGLTPEQNSGTASPAEKGRFQDILGRTNLVYWEWESTASRLNNWLPVLQTSRVLAHRSPLPEKCLPLVWMAAIRPRLGETETRAILTGPDKIEVRRKSTLGLSAAELHLIADWLESPQFPQGLHTFLAPPEANP